MKFNFDNYEEFIDNNYKISQNKYKEEFNGQENIYLFLDLFEKNQSVDLRGLTKGKGFQGPVKRFGITLKVKKSEKGQRRPGSLGPWHPARVIFRVPMAGQLGMFTRAIYNNKIVDIGKAEDKFKNIKSPKDETPTPVPIDNINFSRNPDKIDF